MCHHCDAGADSRATGSVSDRVTRRQLLTCGVAGLAAVTAGCSSSPGGDATTADAPAAITLDDDDACELCGMIIPNHPGPSVEIFYPQHTPSGHENPARFCSTWEAFRYDFDRRDRGWERSVMYVTDYSAVDYDVFEGGGDQLITRHPQADAFVEASAVTFVAGSPVKGAMGKDLIAFSERGDAESFRSTYGGELVGVDEVTPELIAQLANA